MMNDLQRENAKRTLMEEMLRSNAEMLRTISDSALDAIIMMDAGGRIAHWNPAAERMFGYSHSEAMGRGVHDILVPPQYREAAERGVAHFVASGQGNAIGKTLELEALRKDGTQFPVEIAINGIQIDGQWRAVAIVRDTTYRRRTEEALRESEIMYRTIFDSSRDAVMTLTPEEGFFSGNAATVELFGCQDEAEFTSCGPADHSPERQPDNTLSTVKAQKMMAIAMKEGSHFFEWTHKRRDGSEFPATVLLTRVDLGYRTFLQATVRDITEQKKAEAALKKMHEELRHSQKMEAIGELAGGTAHEFNNLLQAIGGYTRFAMQGLSPEDQRCHDLEQVLKAHDRAATLTKQLLGFGRRQVLRQEAVCPNKVVAELADMLRPLIGEDIELEVFLDEDMGTIQADPGVLQQMLLNLCLNARDAMPGGGCLTVRTANVLLDGAYCKVHPDSTPGKYVQLSVSDTGCGMSAEARERIFEPFFTTKEVGEGTGLGLAMVYGAVQQHHGTICVYSEPGDGTTFKIRLPVEEDPAMDFSATLAEPPAAVEGGRETILVADDEPMIRQLALRILKKAGYATLTAADGEEAVRVFEENADNVSLLLLDVMMPRMKGHDTYHRIKTIRPDIQAIFCTGYDPESNQAGSIRDDGLVMIEKPFDPNHLLKTVRQVLDANIEEEVLAI